MPMGIGRHYIIRRDITTKLCNPPSTTPTGFPWLYPKVCTHVYPERAGIPKLEGFVCHSSLGSSGDINIYSPTRVSAAVTGMFHKRSNVLAGLFQTLPASLPGSTPLICVLTTRPTPCSERQSEHPRTIFLYGSSVYTMCQS